MPPRYAYWTILIDGRPTAFRAREKEELQPTFHQLCRTNTDVVLKWFARGRLWQTPDAAQAGGRDGPAREKRGSDWRPGGAHKDPRGRFKKGGKPGNTSTHPAAVAGGSRDRARGAAPRGSQPWRDRPQGATPSATQPLRAKPGANAARGDRPGRDRPDRTSPGGVRPANPSQPPGSSEPPKIKPYP